MLNGLAGLFSSGCSSIVLAAREVSAVEGFDKDLSLIYDLLRNDYLDFVLDLESGLVR